MKDELVTATHDAGMWICQLIPMWLLSSRESLNGMKTYYVVGLDLWFSWWIVLVGKPKNND